MKQSGNQFLHRFRVLIVLAWVIPPIFGLSFLMLINMFTTEQMITVLSTFPQLSFDLVSLIIAVWYFSRFIRPVVDYLDNPSDERAVAALVQVRAFPVRFWGVFLLYLLVAPSTVIFSAEYFTDFVARPVDWFRINLVALTTSIIVGLPIFFSLFDLFGRALQTMRLEKPIVSIRTKVFLIGALIPLLVGTMLVQYYWTRTGYFTTETFLFWGFLQVLAVAGALIFVRSFGQSLQPLQGVVEGVSPTLLQKPNLRATSTDELGVLTERYQGLLEHLHFQGQTMAVGNRVLRSMNTAATTGEAYDSLVNICCHALDADSAYLALSGAAENELVAVSMTRAAYRPQGHFSVSLNEPSLLAHTFKQGCLVTIDNAEDDPRVSPRLVKQLEITSAIAAPLIAEGEVIGVVCAATNGRVRHFTKQDSEMMELLAREATAVVHAQMLQDKRQHAESRYQEMHELASVTLGSISDGVVATDMQGKVVYLNPVAEQFTGWDSEQAQGHHLTTVLQLVDGFNGRPAADPVSLCLQRAGGFLMPGPLSLVSRDGDKEFSVEVRVSPIREADSQLRGQLRGVVLIFHDNTELTTLSRQLSYQASHDALTGLINRNEFEALLEFALARSQADQVTHALCYLDLDQFKVVNDTCGHVAGDELLKQLAARMRGLIREQDTLARLGGDEFGLLIEDCSLDQARTAVEKIQAMVRGFRFEWRDNSFTVGLSIGLVPITAKAGNITDILSAADSACYVAKDLGRNQLHVFEQDDFALVRRRGEMQWLQEIRDALETDRFRLFHQPIQSLQHEPDQLPSRQYSEILLRLMGNDGEIVLPNTFLPVAERYHLMPSIDRWVVRHALQLLQAQSECVIPVHYAINLSAQSLCDGDFLNYVLAELAESGVTPERVCFEITETTAIANLGRAMRFISELKDQGCRFALDDFGSGLSSFSYLKNLPVDFLKIDGLFVKDIDTNPIDKAMVVAINQIGHLMGIETVAEFVTNAAVMAELQAIGVDYGQGYHIARPVEVTLTPQGEGAQDSVQSIN